MRRCERRGSGVHDTAFSAEDEYSVQEAENVGTRLVDAQQHRRSHGRRPIVCLPLWPFARAVEASRWLIEEHDAGAHQ